MDKELFIPKIIDGRIRNDNRIIIYIDQFIPFEECVKIGEKMNKEMQKRFREYKNENFN